MIVPRSLLPVARRARDGQVREVVAAPLRDRPDVLERGRTTPTSVMADGQLGVAVNAPADPDHDAIEGDALERAIRDRGSKEQLVTTPHP